jgi:hypothetical protein
MIMNREQLNISEELIMTYFNVLSVNLSEESEENQN